LALAETGLDKALTQRGADLSGLQPVVVMAEVHI